MNLKDHLKIVADMLRGHNTLPKSWRYSPADLLIAHGKSYPVNPETFKTKRGEAHACYMNAGRAALDNPAETYVEGYVSVHGVPINHGWTIDKNGKVIDITTGGKGIVEYFGVPIKTNYLRKTILRTRVWGLLDPRHNEQIYKDDPKVYVAS